jgi:DNA-binding protein HU-beta
MNKAQLVASVQQHGGFASRAEAADALEAVVAAISDGIEADGRVQVVGFGTFEIRTRAARTGRNPRTGDAIRIEESKSVGFKAGKGLKTRI